MDFKLKMLVLTILVMSCSARLLAEGEDGEKIPGEEPKPIIENPPEEGHQTEENKPLVSEPILEKEIGDKSPENITPPEGENALSQNEPKKEDVKKVEPPIEQAKPLDHEPRGIRFYVLMGAGVLILVGVCAAFIMSKPKN